MLVSRRFSQILADFADVVNIIERLSFLSAQSAVICDNLREITSILKVFLVVCRKKPNFAQKYQYFLFKMKKVSLDTDIIRIRAIVEEMQKGISDFDKQVELFKEASALIKACQNYLNESEIEIKQLIGDEEKAL